MAGRWTIEELTVIRELYPRGGVEACMPHLAGRTRRAIYGLVHALGVKVERDQLARAAKERELRRLAAIAAARQPNVRVHLLK